MTKAKQDTLFHLVIKKKILQTGVMTSSNIGSLPNVDHLVNFNVVLKHYLNSQPPWDINLLSLSLSVPKNSGQPRQETAISNERMTYIVSGIAFILLLVLCFVLGFWCYRRSRHTRIKRLFTVVVTSFLRWNVTLNILVNAKLGQLGGESLNVLPIW